jgi:hypothetical protein
MSRFVATAPGKSWWILGARFGDLNRASVVRGFTRARRRRHTNCSTERPVSGQSLPAMKTLQPILFTAAVVIGTLVLVFRFAPVGIRKVIVGN